MQETRNSKIVVLMLLWLVAGSAFGAADGPRAVSPGGTSSVDGVDARCPTFSWGTVPGAERYELVVYRVDRAGGAPELLLEESLPGSATAWTPALGACFRPGGRYAWSVRSVAGERASEWSAPRIFRVVDAAAPRLREAPGADPPGGAPQREETDDGSSPPAAESRRPPAEGSVTQRAGTGTRLDVGGGIAATRVEATGAITGGASLSLDGATDTVSASSGSLSFGDENVITTGTTSAGGLTIAGLDCSGHARGGVLSAGAGGVVSCSDDGGLQVAPDSLDLPNLADSLTADATTSIDLDDAGADLGVDGSTLFVDSSEDRVGVGTSDPGAALGVVGDLRASGTIGAIDGVGLAMGDLDQEPGTPTVVGGLDVGELPRSVFVSGRYAYVIDFMSNGLEIVDLSQPSSPSLVGSLGFGGTSDTESVFVSGRYAYVPDSEANELRVIDVSDPSSPASAGSVAVATLGSSPGSVFVSGRYAYVVGSRHLTVVDAGAPTSPTVAGSVSFGTSLRSVFVSGSHAYVIDETADELVAIDVSDPSAPTLDGRLALSGSPRALSVSGRHAYVLEADSDELLVVDVSSPDLPTLAGSVALGGFSDSVFVSGRYAYVANQGSEDLQVIDVADPTSPRLIGQGAAFRGVPQSVFVSGRHAVVVSFSPTDDHATFLGHLEVVDVTGAELPSATVHSLEAGPLQVRESVLARGQLRVTGGATIGSGGLFSDGDVGVAGTFALADGVAPTSSPADAVQLYAEDAGGGTELRVRDEAGNVTTLSPHDFSLVGEPSEPLAWSHSSANDAGRVNVDVLRTVRLVERLSGERLVHARAPDGSVIEPSDDSGAGLRAELEALRRRTRALEGKNRRLRRELAWIERMVLPADGSAQSDQ